MSLRRCLLMTAMMTLVSCGRADNSDQTAADTQQDSAADTSGMAGMPGMSGQTDMMAGMKSHMGMMQGLSADSMMKLMPEHRQLAGNMLAQMNKEMRDMSMSADPAWNALADSIRADLAAMPQWNTSEVTRLMPDHHGRVSRLIAMHETMMKHM